MKRVIGPALMAASVFLVFGELNPARAGDDSNGLFSNQKALSVDVLDETRGLGGGGIEDVRVESNASSGGGGPGGSVIYGDSTFGSFGGVNNNAFALAAGASAVAQLTINVNLAGGAN